MKVRAGPGSGRAAGKEVLGRGTWKPEGGGALGVGRLLGEDGCQREVAAGLGSDPRVPILRCPPSLRVSIPQCPCPVPRPDPFRVPVSRPIPPPRSRGEPLSPAPLRGPRRRCDPPVSPGPGGAMAGRRAALKAVDWAAFAERVPPSQRAMFNALKTRNDALTAR